MLSAVNENEKENEQEKCEEGTSGWIRVPCQPTFPTSVFCLLPWADYCDSA